MKREKVLYIITKSVWGGAQRYVFDLATHLPKRLSPVVALGGSEALKDRLEQSGVRVVTVESFQRDMSILRDVESFLELLKIIKREEPDIVHVNSSKAGGLGTLAARLLGVRRIVFTAHGWAFKEKRGSLPRFLIKLSSWITVALSHSTITVSEDDKDRSRWMPFVNYKISTIHNGIELPDFKDKESARDILKQKIGAEPKNNTWIGMIVELHKNKGLNYAIEAFSKLEKRHSDTALIIVGEGEDRSKLTNIIEERELSKRIFLTGEISSASEYLTAFDVFMLTSIKEGLPYTLLEAGFAGLPVVGTCVGGIPEVVDDMESGIVVKPRSSEEIQKALSYILENQEKAKTFGHNLREKVSKQFGLKRMIAKTIKKYE